MNKGVCVVCRTPTKAWDKFWTRRCPKHWQQLEKA